MWSGTYASKEARARVAGWAHDGTDIFRDYEMSGIMDDGSGRAQEETKEHEAAVVLVEAQIKELPHDVSGTGKVALVC